MPPPEPRLRHATLENVKLTLNRLFSTLAILVSQLRARPTRADNQRPRNARAIVPAAAPRQLAISATLLEVDPNSLTTNCRR
jgi:hypothetical protein